MTRLLICLLALASSAPALACDTAAEATTQSDCVVMERAGQRGVWFNLAQADEIRRLRLEVPELRLQITNLERAVDVQTQRVDLYREAGQLRREASEVAQMALNDALARETRLRSELDAWYRSPVFWLVVGVVVTAAAFIGGALAL